MPIKTCKKKKVSKEKQPNKTKSKNGKCTANKRTANHNKGKCAERLVKQYYASKTGYTMMDEALHSTPNMVSGIDHITIVGNTAIFIETKANTAQHTKAQKYGNRYKDKQEQDMERGAYDNEGRYKQRTEAQQREYDKQLKYKKIDYHKCRVKLKPDHTHCYGAGGRGRCKAAGKIECGKWQTKN